MLTKRQFQLLKFIHDYHCEKGVSPSYDEMRRAMDLKSKSGIHRLVSSLEERGFIKRLAYRARAVELLKPPPQTAAPALAPFEGEHVHEPAASPNIVQGRFSRTSNLHSVKSNRLPLIGKIAAGLPIDALDGRSALIDIPPMMMGSGDCYVVEIEGDSMIEAGIMDGDLAVIERCDTAENGSIVVALIDGHEATLKRLRRRGASIALEPANAAYETRIYGPNQVTVQGQLVGLMRRY